MSLLFPEADEILQYLESIDSRLGIIENNQHLILNTIRKGFITMALDFSRLQAQVTRETTVEASLEALVGQLVSEVAALKQEVANAPDLSTAQAQVDAFAQTLSDNADAMSKAVTDNSTDFTPSGNVTVNTGAANSVPTANVATGN